MSLCYPMDCSPPGSSVHGIVQARILGWVAILFSRGSFWPRIEPGSPTFQADSLLFEPPGKPILGIVMFSIVSCQVSHILPHRMENCPQDEEAEKVKQHRYAWMYMVHTQAPQPFFFFFFGFLSGSCLYSLPEAQLYSFFWFYKTPVSLNKSFFCLNHLGFCHMQPRSIRRYIFSPQFIFLLWYSTFGS